MTPTRRPGRPRLDEKEVSVPVCVKMTARREVRQEADKEKGS
jgi:hypothetical protein